ncbi:uncharacterized protein N7515_003737 [Penicillium bovifimosum]|uniref:Uncharacterized protein n=1 Tax=Penicillium bovifimosum TaxID=126998 RepID=A0A9W9H6K7_9EURO|nr:uncharacterized protein N7515_003737 [Penicillium bovifimosum]KAJ5138889.1 hypothetical protein N7515_003737 [Penicillium bovifimosum]
MEDPQDRSVKDPKKQTAAQRGAVPGFWIPTSSEDWHQLVLAVTVMSRLVKKKKQKDDGSLAAATVLHTGY